MNKKNSKSKKKIFKSQENEFIFKKAKINLIILIITLGAIVAAIAPFSHIPFDRTSTTKVFGFRNARVFLYSLGMPITILLGSLIMSFTANFIEIKLVFKVLRNVSIVFLSVALYYLIWTFTASSTKDWNPILYYLMALSISISIGVLINKYLKSIAEIPKRFYNISNNIPLLDKRIKTVNEIAKIMPSNNEDIATYKTMVDITGDNLKYVVSEIKKELNHEEK
ncbi:hypothetical protein ACSTS3_10490 [Aquimarina muelleri]|uniref:hypothetical protein n=1 Tax=Aquimarina muelleri TaxID=279356 RepID=UPI003F68935B